MPLSINVGLSRKASRDYQSAGVSINVTAELDQALLARPNELQKQVGDLYAQARAALEQQAASMVQPDQQNRTGNGDRRSYRGNGGHDRNERGGGHRNGDMTASQRRAILAIVERERIDLDAECRDIIGVQFDELSISQASALIDHLRGQQAGNGRNGGR